MNSGCSGLYTDADWIVADPPEMLLQQWMTTDDYGNGRALNFFDLISFKGCIASFYFESQAGFDQYRSSAVIAFPPEQIYKYTFFKRGSEYSLVFVNEFNDDIVYYISNLKRNSMTVELHDGTLLKFTRVDPPVKVVRE